MFVFHWGLDNCSSEGSPVCSFPGSLEVCLWWKACKTKSRHVIGFNQQLMTCCKSHVNTDMVSGFRVGLLALWPPFFLVVVVVHEFSMLPKWTIKNLWTYHQQRPTQKATAQHPSRLEGLRPRLLHPGNLRLWPKQSMGTCQATVCIHWRDRLPAEPHQLHGRGENALTTRDS